MSPKLCQCPKLNSAEEIAIRDLAHQRHLLFEFFAFNEAHHLANGLEAQAQRLADLKGGYTANKGGAFR